MFELWSQPEVCKHSGPAVDSSGRAIELPARAPSESDRLLEYWLEFVGAVGFNALGACCEYAYHLVPRFWGAGLASEASRIAADWAFSHGAESVEAFVEPANPRSVRLVERLGYRRIHQRPEGPSRYVLTREQTRPESR
jgi:RimJ/RimL family protein N-acetyltransferase